MNFRIRVFFIAIVALCFFLITSTDSSVAVSEAHTNSASAIAAASSTSQSVPDITAPKHAQTPPAVPASPAAHSSSAAPIQAPVAPPQPAQSSKATTLIISAWLHNNDWSAGVESLKSHASLIREASPAWYQTDATANIMPRNVPVDDAALMALARQSGIIVRPLIMGVAGAGPGPQALSAILASPQLRQKQVASLTALANAHGYDGLDLDYEGIPLANLDDLAAFVEELSSSLHASGKTLAVSVDAQSNEDALSPLARIGKAADSVRLMAYGNKSTTQAPVVDLAWMKARLAFALKAIPTEKLSLGIPVYCYKWTAKGLGSDNWQKLHAQTSYPVSCQDASVVKEEIEIGKSFGVTHFALWRLGGEDRAIWQDIESL